MNMLLASSARVMLVLATAVSAVSAAPALDPVPTNGVARLLEGNARYAAARAKHPRQDNSRRREIASSQHPFAVVVSCSDSRVPPEVVFDQGLGDIFVVRTAGHVVDSVAMGSIEFAVAKLGVRSIFVVGHERCGAVQAALEHATVPGSIGVILESIGPAVGGPEKATPATMERAVERQVGAVARQLRETSPVLAPLVNDGSLAVGGGVYDLDTGKVTPIAPAAGN